MRESFTIPLADTFGAHTFVGALACILLASSWGLFIATAPLSIVAVTRKYISISRRYKRITQYSLFNNILLILSYLITESYGRLAREPYFTTPFIPMLIILAPAIIGMPLQLMLLIKSSVVEEDPHAITHDGP
jgi:hypothetical protein